MRVWAGGEGCVREGNKVFVGEYGNGGADGASC